MSELHPGELVIDDANFEEHVETLVDGQMMSRGAIMRDYSKHPVGCYEAIEPFSMPLIPRNEWSSRIKDMEQSKSRLSDMRAVGDNGKSIPSTDQGTYGYCWNHSVVSGMLLGRARDGLPYVPLSAFSIGCPIKNFRNEGGWNPLALERVIKVGVAPASVWPMKSVDRRLDNNATWKAAGRFKVTEGFMDLTPPVYDRNLTFDQLMTCLLSRIPCPVDYAWWGHSICAADPVEIDSGLSLNDINRWGIRIWNSWTDSWSQLGMGVLRGSKAVPDGATAIKVVTHTED